MSCPISFIFRPGRDNTTEGLLQQLDQLVVSLERSENENQILNQSLVQEKASGRQRHLALVEDLTKALTGRDRAIQAIKRLESYCQQFNVPTIGAYEVRLFDFIVLTYTHLSYVITDDQT